MQDSGYYRYPAIFGDEIAFISEDDIWVAPADGGRAERRTSGLGAMGQPRFSPDGASLTFTGREEGDQEIYRMPAAGGPVERITYLGAVSVNVGWMTDGRIVFASNHGRPFSRWFELFAAHPQGGAAERLPYGAANEIAFGPGGAIALGRNVSDPARWKRYRGGTVGQIWLDAEGTGKFRRLLGVDGNLADPVWLGERLYFLSDHEGVGNIYSVNRELGDLRRHTDHETYYARNASGDGRRIVYHAGADLYVFDPQEGARRVEIAYPGQRTQRQRKFVDAARFLTEADVHPGGHKLALTARGQLFSLGNWHGPVLRVAPQDGVRHRLGSWLADGNGIVAVSDAGGEEQVCVYGTDGDETRRFDSLDLGQLTALVPAPKGDLVAAANQRGELFIVDLEKGATIRCAHSVFGRIANPAWSADARYLAFAIPDSAKTVAIHVYDRETGESHAVTRPVREDRAPAFDPKGKYLYFLSARIYDPVPDSLTFDLGFPRGMRPYLVTLQRDLPSPFLPEPQPMNKKPGAEKDADAADEEETLPAIEFEGILDRVVAFPVADGVYGQLAAIEGKVLYTTFPVEGTLLDAGMAPEPDADGTLHAYDLEKRKGEVLARGIGSFRMSLGGGSVVIRSGRKLRVVKAGEKIEEKAGEEPGRESGLVDLGRVRVSVLPGAEWSQMLREGWRLLRDNFWDEDMSGADWEAVYSRYRPLVERVSTRGELSDLMWEMQGELGTSHAYEMFGDYRRPPDYAIGQLAADFAWDDAAGAYRVVYVARGDSWDERAASPLQMPGALVAPGDHLYAIDGRPLDEATPPGRLLVGAAGQEIELLVGRGEEKRRVRVKALRHEALARYRDWVERNRAAVHSASDGRIGYVHVPDMGSRGYSEFFRSYLVESQRDALIVDVRYNGGGNVSQLLLEKLLRRRIGYDAQRWGSPEPYPGDSVAGPIVALTNENAGSDGDIFSHAFKLFKVGPLLGERTWGGVIGIYPRHPLVDMTVTTQPEFSFWFVDVGWGVENYGTDPDIEVVYRPQDYMAGEDPQLQRAIAEAARRLQERGVVGPNFGPRPSRRLPKLPPRS
ncbi:MAG: PDZ domain-containing protein [Thermaerobacter sp.]|nr:PDZ domain-containing protein [Thermaerobacter sp.]